MTNVEKLVRFLERDVRRIGGSSATAPSMIAARRAQFRQYVELLSRKRSAFWTSRVVFNFVLNLLDLYYRECKINNNNIIIVVIIIIFVLFRPPAPSR